MSTSSHSIPDQVSPARDDVSQRWVLPVTRLVISTLRPVISGQACLGHDDETETGGGGVWYIPLIYKWSQPEGGRFSYYERWVKLQLPHTT